MNTLSGIILDDKNQENEDFPVLPSQISRSFLKRVSRSVSRTVSNTELIQNGFQERVLSNPHFDPLIRFEQLIHFDRFAVFELNQDNSSILE